MVATAAATGAVLVALGSPWSAEVRFPRPGILGVGLVAGVTAFLVATALGLPLGATLIAGLAAAPAPSWSMRQAAGRRARTAAERWPDFLTAVRSRLATGASMPEACAAAARHLGGAFACLDRGPGQPFSTTIAQARQTWSDSLADRVLMSLEAAETAGGPTVGAVLGSLAASVADDLRLRRAHHAALTEQRLTAAVALLAPWAILVLSILTNPTAAEAFATPTGNAIVGGGAIATLVGFAMARRAARLSRPPRVFS